MLVWLGMAMGTIPLGLNHKFLISDSELCRLYRVLRGGGQP